MNTVIHGALPCFPTSVLLSKNAISQRSTKSSIMRFILRKDSGLPQLRKSHFSHSVWYISHRSAHQDAVIFPSDAHHHHHHHNLNLTQSFSNHCLHSSSLVLGTLTSWLASIPEQCDSSLKFIQPTLGSSLNRALIS